MGCFAAVKNFLVLRYDAMQRESEIVRVISGVFGGRKLRAAPAKGVRPTSDRVREALFSSLGDLTGLRILDLYAGTGSLGIEALSRGAESCCFVEKAPSAVVVLRANLQDLELEERVTLLRLEVCAAIRRMSLEKRIFDIIFLDPPYASAQAERALEALVQGKLVSPTGQIVVESSKHYPVAKLKGLLLIDERAYGETVITRWAT